MKPLGKRFIAGRIEDRILARTESMDARIMQIDFNNNFVYVKIQGSNKTIKVLWPQNLEQQPSWMRVGNAVRISFTGGNRGRLEIVGHGTYIPTGGGALQQMVPEDAIMSGLVIIK
jgi:hypothetical protein